MSNEELGEQMVKLNRAIVDDPLGFLLPPFRTLRDWLYDWCVRLKMPIHDGRFEYYGFVSSGPVSFTVRNPVFQETTFLVIDELHDGTVEEGLVRVGPEWPREGWDDGVVRCNGGGKA